MGIDSALTNPCIALQCILFMRICCVSPFVALSKMICAEPNFKISNKIKAKMVKTKNKEQSMKFFVFCTLLDQIAEQKDKVVVVSNFKFVLDQIEPILVSKKFKFLRLDGSTKSHQRSKLVSLFNSKCDFFCFLLSAKAGGVGLNLVGANRLILMEPDWNPASDQQAMARIWRDGQTKKCKIYRLIGIGSIEEKILQRQISKMEIANSVVDRFENNKNKKRHFSEQELKKIFSLSKECKTHKIKMKQWKVCSDKQRIKEIVPIKDMHSNSKHVPVILHKCVNRQFELNQFDFSFD